MSRRASNSEQNDPLSVSVSTKSSLTKESSKVSSNENSARDEASHAESKRKSSSRGSENDDDDDDDDDEKKSSVNAMSNKLTKSGAKSKTQLFGGDREEESKKDWNESKNKRTKDINNEKLVLRNLHIKWDSKLKDETTTTFEEGKTTQILTQKSDLEDFEDGFHALRAKKTPINKEPLRVPYVYPDLICTCDKVAAGVLHAEYTIAQPTPKGSIRWWTEKYDAIKDKIAPHCNTVPRIQVITPTKPKRDFTFDKNEVDALGDPRKLTYRHIEKIRATKKRILKKYDKEWKKNRGKELDLAWEETQGDKIPSDHLKERFQSIFDIYMHDPRNPKPKRRIKLKKDEKKTEQKPEAKPNFDIEEENENRPKKEMGKSINSGQDFKDIDDDRSANKRSRFSELERKEESKKESGGTSRERSKKTSKPEEGNTSRDVGKLESIEKKSDRPSAGEEKEERGGKRREGRKGEEEGYEDSMEKEEMSDEIVEDSKGEFAEDSVAKEKGEEEKEKGEEEKEGARSGHVEFADKEREEGEGEGEGEEDESVRNEEVEVMLDAGSSEYNETESYGGSVEPSRTPLNAEYSERALGEASESETERPSIE